MVPSLPRREAGFGELALPGSGRRGIACFRPDARLLLARLCRQQHPPGTAAIWGQAAVTGEGARRPNLTLRRRTQCQDAAIFGASVELAPTLCFPLSQNEDHFANAEDGFVSIFDVQRRVHAKFAELKISNIQLSQRIAPLTGVGLVAVRTALGLSLGRFDRRSISSLRRRAADSRHWG
jgi:hypothetical protein